MSLIEKQKEIIIEKLVNKTKNNQIEWERFPQLSLNNLLREFLLVLKEGIIKTDSFFANYEEGYFILLKRTISTGEWWETTEVFSLIIQSSERAKPTFIVSENEEGLQSELIRLNYLIEEQISDNFNFLNTFLND